MASNPIATFCVGVGVTLCTRYEHYYAHGGGTRFGQRCPDLQNKDLDWAGILKGRNFMLVMPEVRALER